MFLTRTLVDVQSSRVILVTQGEDRTYWSYASNTMKRPDPNAKRLILALDALGVVFGDIGTGPLYTISECLGHLGKGPFSRPMFWGSFCWWFGPSRWLYGDDLAIAPLTPSSA
jgi:hypothetical protein